MESFLYFPANATDNYNFEDADQLFNSHDPHWPYWITTSFQILNWRRKTSKRGDHKRERSINNLQMGER